MLNGTAHRLGVGKGTYIYEKIEGGLVMAHIQEFPHVTAIGKTEIEARKKLDLDLQHVSKMIEKNQAVHA